jgi:uncharacterized membrane protein YbaN (DUF454 family)
MEEKDYPKGSSGHRRLGSSRFKRGLFVIAGTIFLGLGSIGIILPVLPTTPFLLLSAACYYRSSERLHQWMLNNRWFGNYIRNYKEGKGIPLKTKVLVLSLLWISITYSAVFIITIFFVQIVLFIIAVGVSAHIVRLPTFKRS